MKKYVTIILCCSLVLLLSVSAYSYIALNLDCADTNEYDYSDEVFYYDEMNILLDYDPDADMWYFYDTEWETRVYVPDYQPEAEEIPTE